MIGPAGFMQAPKSDLAEMERLAVDKVREAFGVPQHLLIEPGHVMSAERYQQLMEEQRKQQ